MPETTPQHAADGLIFSRDAIRALDRQAINLGIPAIVLMENAAAALERVVLEQLAPPLSPTSPAAPTASDSRRAHTTNPATTEDNHHAPPVVILSGPGANGGDGLALARRLLAVGIRSSVILAAPRHAFAGDALTQLNICQSLGIPIADGASVEVPRDARLYIDAIFGTGLTRPIQDLPARLVKALNAARKANDDARVIAVDAPSGLDVDTGAPIDTESPIPVVVQADITVTLGGMKRGLLQPAALRYAGTVTVGPIGVPRSLLKRYAER